MECKNNSAIKKRQNDNRIKRHATEKNENEGEMERCRMETETRKENPKGPLCHAHTAVREFRECG